MNLLEYKNTFGREQTVKLCLLCGTTYDNYKHLMNKRKGSNGKPRKPSVSLAKRFVEHSGGKIYFAELFN